MLCRPLLAGFNLLHTPGQIQQDWNGFIYSKHDFDTDVVSSAALWELHLRHH